MAADILQALIIPQGGNAALAGTNILVELLGGKTTGIDVTLGQQANSYPIPADTSITSTIRSTPDIININGWVRCVFCNGNVNFAAATYLAIFKRAMEEQKYNTNALARIVFNDGIMNNMRLSSVNFRRDGNLPQETQIYSSWEQVNVAGTVNSAALDIGGVLA